MDNKITTYGDYDYWFARGYYDGRSKGTPNTPADIDDLLRHQYKRGYDVGVADYCEFDINNEEEA